MSSPPLSQGDQASITEARTEASTVSNAMSRLGTGGPSQTLCLRRGCQFRHLKLAYIILALFFHCEPNLSVAKQQGGIVMAYYMVRLYSGAADRSPEQLCQQAGSE